jgi:hypothetical protein
MREIRGDIMKLITTGEYDAFCITTNGCVKANGECVMGRGIALTCRDKYPGLAKHLGSHIREYGNHAFSLATIKKTGVRILSFPVKHKWNEVADVELIKRSAGELMDLADKYDLNNILLPRPGCGNGLLKWSVVKSAIEPILDKRVIVATF